MGRRPANKSGYNGLMQQVCVVHGWCGGIVGSRSSHVDDFIPESGAVSADQFVDWLFMADGIDPIEERERWVRQRAELKAAYVHYMGADVVDASLLKWAV